MVEALPRRRAVATRVGLAFAVVMVVFAVVAGYSVVEQSNAAGEAELMRSGYMPLALELHDLVGVQDRYNGLLNDITDAKNPAHLQVSLEAARLGRLKRLSELRTAMTSFASSGDPRARGLGRELLAETARIEAYLSADGAELARLFDALNRKNDTNVDSLHDALSRRGAEGARRLNALEQSVKRRVEILADTAQERERRAVLLLLGLSFVTLLVSIAVALYARSVLKPLAVVTERAKSVARGDLTPRSVVASNDEIGELAQTFENMVAAIARANEQLLASERLATIGKMAAHVTHEVRNPLSSIALNLELLEDDLSGNAEASGLLRAIRAEVDRLTALSEQYLSVARQQPLMLDEEDVAQVVGEAVEFSKGDLTRHGVRLEFSADPDLPPARIDEAQLKQAVFNLIRNAREAMPNGGRLELNVGRAAGGGIDVIVDDEGVGMDDEARARLFEPFFTTKKHGTGLGLAITRQIVEAHGGVIACEGRPSRGTRMRIHLPEIETSEQPVSARRLAAG